jgi:hypothetical protein
MVAYTTAKGLYQVANSSYVGTWDVPENSNWGVVDAALGQITTIQLNNTPVTLTAAQVQSCQLVFSSSAAPGGNLAGNVAITFATVSPSSSVLTGPYIIQNLCGNSSLYVVTLQTTVAGGQAIACKPGEAFDVVNDGTNFKFKNMGHIGSYWDYAGSSVPNWVTACTVPPYLNCDGTSFSSATYPTLAAILGTTLPDSKGRTRFTLNQGSTRITSSATYGIDGNTILAGGGSQTLAQAQLPNVTLSSTGLSVPSLSGAVAGTIFSFLALGGQAGPIGNAVLSSAIAGSVPLGGSGYNLLPPGYVSGITMIRAA